MKPDGGAVRVSEILAVLSLATDLGTGQPIGHALRVCAQSVAVARRLGLDDEQVREVHHVALLRFLGCSSDASETAAMAGGDNLAFNARMAPVLNGSTGEQVKSLSRAVGPGQRPLRKARLLAAAMADSGAAARSFQTHCEVAARLGTRLGIGDAVVRALSHAYTRWDGKGVPEGVAGSDIPESIRIVAVVRDKEMLDRIAPDEVGDLLAARRGRAYDPAVVDVVLSDGHDPADVVPPDGEGAWSAAIAAEPDPVRYVEPGQLDAAVAAIGDFADLYTPWTRGRASRVAELARDAAMRCGVSEPQVHDVWRAGLVMDVGRVGVPAGVLNHPGLLDPDQWESVRLHPYLSERVLARCEALRPLAELAGFHHERLDGSGYHRGARESAIAIPARLLAAADVLVALGEARPYRPACAPNDALAVIRDEVRAGRLDRAAVEAVCDAAGQSMGPVRRTWPNGLTDREVDVLRLIARGRSNREVAQELHISPKTVGRHIENLYGKLDVSTRAAAALFAMEERLL